MPPEATLTQLYCTDEDIAVRAPDDYVQLCPTHQLLAKALDGSIAGGSWTLASASVGFAGQGVASNQVVQITGPKPAFTGTTGQLFAVDTVSSGSITLRRIGQATGVGQPPSASSLTGVTFSIATLNPQIEDVSYDINRRYHIDPGIPWETPGIIYDLRDLRQLAVLEVLQRRYAIAARTQEGDFAMKLKLIQADMDDLLGRVNVRWGQFGNQAPESGPFSSRIVR